MLGIADTYKDPWFGLCAYAFDECSAVGVCLSGVACYGVAF